MDKILLLLLYRMEDVKTLGLERFNIENVQPLGKDLPANPCREFVAGGLPAVSDTSQA